MSSVDDRIVNMQFNNKQFVSAATETQKTLEGLERTIANTGNSKGLTAMASSVDQVTSRFSALQVAGVAAIATIASKAVSLGLNMVKSLTIDPITSGFQEYETNLKSVQIIMANTGENIRTTSKYLNDLNKYSDRTIYNFSQMADSIGKFTAAGVKLPAATSAIKGMANAAALSGANAMQLNSAMYQMSQALASGTIKLMDWNSLVNANMGGQNIQKALMATTRTLEDEGKAMDAAIKTHGTFRDSLTEGWLTSEVFTKTMKVMAGEVTKSGKAVAYTVAELQKMGYSKEAAEELNRLSAAAIESATKIKTVTQLFDVVKESIGSGFAKVFKRLFGNVNKAGELWTKVGGIITGAVSTVFGTIDDILGGWKRMDGHIAMWAAFGNIFQTIGNLLHPFVAAFQALFPATGKAGEGLATASKGFESVTAWMEKASRNAELLTPYLVAVATAIKKGFGGIGTAVGFIKDLADSLGGLKGALTGLSISDFNMENFLKIGDKAVDFGRNIVQGLVQGMGMSVSELTASVARLADSVIQTFRNILGIHSPAQAMVPLGEAIVQGLVQGIVAVAGLIWDSIMGLGSIIVDAFSAMFGGMDSMDWAVLMNTLLTGGLILSITNISNSFGGIMGTLDSLRTSVEGTFGAMTDTLGAMQNKLKAEALKAIAIAIGLLAAAALVLSLIKVPALVKALTAIGTMLALLVGSLFALSKINAEGNLALLSTSILILSMAMVNLALATTLLGSQDLASLAKGLGALALTLGILIATMFAFSKIKGSIAGMAGSILIIAIAMNALAAAVLAFGLMDVGTLAKGLGAMAIALGLMVATLLGLSKMKGSIEGAAASILVISIAMNILAGAIALLGSMDFWALTKGLVAMAVGLGIMVAVLLALAAIAATGIGAAGIALAAAAMFIMAEAVVAMAIGLKILVGVLDRLAAMDWAYIIKGIAALTLLAIPILAVGAAALAVAPGLIALGISMGLIGAGLFLAGAGMLAFATGFALLATVGVAGIGILVIAVQAFLGLLPAFAIQMAAALVSFLEAISRAAPRIREAMSKIFSEMIGVARDAIPEMQALIADLVEAIFKTVRQAIPQYGKIIQTLIETGIRIIRNLIPQVVLAATDVALALLRGIEKKIPEIAKVAVDIILAFLDAIADEYPRLVDGAAKALVKFINGLATAIDENASAIRSAGLNLARAFIEAVSLGLLSEGVSAITGAIGELVGRLPDPRDILSKTVAGGVKDSFISRVTAAVEAAIKMANAIIAAGDEEVLKLQEAASKRQGEAFAAQANANIRKREASQEDHRATKRDRVAEDRAREAERMQQQADRNEEKAKRLRKQNEAAAKKLMELAKRQEKAADKMKEAAKEAAKAAKAQEKAAEKAQKAAEAAQKAADKAQKAADKAAEKVRYQQEFNAADLLGKYEMKQDEAVAYAEKAQQLLAKANAEAAQAQKLLNDKNKKNDAEGQRLLIQSRETAKAAADYAALAQQSRTDADEYYRQAKAEEAATVYDRIAEIEAQRQADADALRAQEEYDVATTEGKAEILANRARASEARAQAAAALAQAAMDQARAVASTDAARAMELLNYAEEQANLAAQAASQAKQERDQAKQMLEQAEDEKNKPAPGSSDTGGGGTSFNPSRSVLEDAAAIIDRYTASLAQAEAAAAATESPVQFVQNNNSPVALTPSEVYRQTKNLLSNAEIKMGAPN